jgi:hypothetical protein
MDKGSIYAVIYCPNRNKYEHDTVEGDSERDTTTLVYLQLHISLYTGAVHVLRRVAGVHPPV